MSLREVISIVIGSPPGSSVRFALDKGWDRTSTLLANQQEAQSGLIGLPTRYERPGVVEASASPSKFMPMDSYTQEELDRKLKERYARGAKAGPSPTAKMRVFSKPPAKMGGQ